MSLDVKISVEPAELRYQQDATLRVTLFNKGPAALTLRLPFLVLTPRTMSLRVINTATGVEKIYSRPLKPHERMLAAEEDRLEPGRSQNHSLTLLSLPGSLAPGDYEISAIYAYNEDKDSAESAPVKIRVKATTPRNLFYSEAQGVWVNVHADVPEACLMMFEARAGGGPSLLRVVAPASLRAAPILSEGPFGKPVQHPWIAWTDGDLLHVHHHHSSQGTLSLKPLALGSRQARIVPMLHSDAVPDDNSRPEGALLLYRESGELEAFQLAPNGIRSTAKDPFPGPRPLWIWSFERQGGGRTVLAARKNDDKTELIETAWPGKRAAPRVLGAWTGDFMGAGAAVDDANLLSGTLLLRPPPGVVWTRVGFALDGKGAFSASTSPGPASDMTDAFEEAPRVRQGAAGKLLALLRSSKGNWSVYDGAKTFHVPFDLLSTPYPLDIEFMGGGHAALIAGFKEAGFHMRMADGQPLPPADEG